MAAGFTAAFDLDASGDYFQERDDPAAAPAYDSPGMAEVP